MRKVDVVVQPLILALGRQKQEDLRELKLSLVYIQVSHGYTVRLCLKENKQMKRKKIERRSERKKKVHIMVVNFSKKRCSLLEDVLIQ